MSDEIHKTSVQILDKTYQIKCSEDEVSGLLRSASYLDHKIKQLNNSGRLINIEQTVMIAALNITHELLQEREQKEDLINSLNKRIKTLQTKVKNAVSATEEKTK